MSYDDESSGAAAIIDYAKAHVQPVFKSFGETDGEGGDLHFVLVPKGFDLKDLTEKFDERLDRPRRATGTARLQTAESFVAHCKRHSDAHSVLFASGESSLRMQAVYDYHEAAGDDAKPRHCKHRAIYKFPVSLEMQAWMGNNGERMSQETFAEFLEDRLLDVLDPSQASEPDKGAAAQLQLELATPSKLLTLSRGLSITVENEIHDHTSLASGSGQLVFKERHKDSAGQPLSVPGAFLLGIPVFDGGDRWTVLARLRYRVAGGKVTWSYHLHKVREVTREAFHEAAAGIATSTDLPLFFGDPE